MPLESARLCRVAPFGPKSRERGRGRPFALAARVSLSTEETNREVLKELGLFSLKKKIEEVVLRTEIIASTALESEEARRIKFEEMLRGNNLWENITKSNESLNDLDSATRVVNTLKDVQYKAEEAKLITQLAEMDCVNHHLFKQAYTSSLAVSKYLDRYEMSKLLVGSYDREGACMIIRAGPEGHNSEIWAEKLENMYLRWAENQGYRGRVTEKCRTKGNGASSATIEFETEYFYGYLSGEEGVHRMVHSSLDGSVIHETCSAGVEVIPIFLGSSSDLTLDDEILEISSFSQCGHLGHETQVAVRLHHTPTGTTVQCSGERSHFANKMKALNRLKAKLLVTARKLGVSDVNMIRRESVVNSLKHETRRYSFHPRKLVRDVRSGFQMAELHSILDGNIEPFLKASINFRKGTYLT